MRSGAFGATATETRRELARRLAEVRDAATEGDRYRAWERLRRDLDAASPGAGVALFPLATEAVRLSAEVMPS